MLAALAGLATSEEPLAFAARSPDALPRLPVVEILASGLGGPLEDNLLRGRIPVWDNGRVFGAFLDDGRPPLAALLPLSLGALRGHTRALLAAWVLALGTLLAQAKRGVAEMAFSVHTHPDRLLHTKSVTLGFVPLAGRKLQTVQLAQLLCPLRKDLRPGNLSSFHSCGNLCSGCWLAAAMR